MAAIDGMLLKEISAKDDLAVRLGDTLDLKASIALAIIVFLATQTAFFLDKSHGPALLTMLTLSIILLSAGAILAVLELWPSFYLLPGPESEYMAERIAELRQYYDGYQDVDLLVAEQLEKDEIGWAKNRIAINQNKNHRKASLLEAAFWCTGLALATNLLILFAFIPHLS